ncbi:MAG TPA: hypothetical protein VG897_19420 [Terriglobales bacterium]|nr:hypothetical protein [Terriglobales bacterium]
MLLAYRLVRLIETHADKLADSTLKRLEQDKKTRDYFARVPQEDFRAAIAEIYTHLGEWVLGKSEEDIARRYTEIGHRRAAQGVLLSELNWAIVLTRDNLWEFLKGEDTLERPTEVFGELKLLQLLEQFFDCAIYYAAVGYEQYKAAPEKAALHAV